MHLCIYTHTYRENFLLGVATSQALSIKFMICLLAAFSEGNRNLDLDWGDIDSRYTFDMGQTETSFQLPICGLCSWLQLQLHDLNSIFNTSRAF